MSRPWRASATCSRRRARSRGPRHQLLSHGAVVVLQRRRRTPARGGLAGMTEVSRRWAYPPTWTGRIYGEQCLLAALLLGGAAGWTVRFPGWWLVEESELAARFEPDR